MLVAGQHRQRLSVTNGSNAQQPVVHRVRFKVMRSKVGIWKRMGLQQMTAAKLSDEAILASLKAHPGLRDRFASIIGAIENSEGNFKEADAVEERIVEEMRLLGREAMQGSARTRSKRRNEKLVDKLRCIAKVKKMNSAGIRNSARVAVL